MSRHAPHRSTGDLALAAYAHMKGFSVLKAQETRRGRITEYAFTFADPDEQWNDLCVEFANSEAQRHDTSVMVLKRLCKRGR